MLLIGRYCIWYISGILADRTCYAGNVGSMEVKIAGIRQYSSSVIIGCTCIVGRTGIVCGTLTSITAMITHNA